jgi:hypothetical protein
MSRSLLLAGCAGAVLFSNASAFAQIASQDVGSVETVVVTAQRLNAARNGIQTQTGA